MKLTLLICLLFALCPQNAAATDKRRNNGKIKKIFGALLLNYALHAPTTQTNALCPTTLPSYATDMMQYIHCGDKEQTADFFDKYVMNQEESCSKLRGVYQNVKSLGKCATEKFTDIVNGAKQRIVGKTPDRNTEVEMFQDYLMNTAGIGDHIEKLSEKFEKLEKPDFFQIKSATEFFIEYHWEHTELAPELALEEAMKPEYQKLDFDQVRRMLDFAKTIKVYESDQIKMALDIKYQDLDFDKLYYLRQRLAAAKFDNADSLEQLVKPENQSLNWDTVIRMIPYAKKLKVYDRDTIKMAVDLKYQKLNMGKVDRMMPFAKKIKVYESDQIKMALDPEYQVYDLDRNEIVLKALKAFSKDDPEKEALETWIQHKDLNSEKIDKIFKYCKGVKNQLACWNFKTKNFKKSDL